MIGKYTFSLSNHFIWYVLGVAILILWGVFFYVLGYNNVQTKIRDDYLTIFGISDNDYTKEVGTISQIKAIVTQSKLADQVVDNLKHVLAEKENDIAELREQVYFYRVIMAPEDIYKGLSILSAKLGRPIEDGRFPFEIILRKSDSREKMIKGRLNLVLLDKADKNGKRLSIDEFYKGDTNFRFKYFQRLKGMITLPKNFTPVIIEASMLSNSAKDLKKNWYWGDLLGGEHAYK